MVAVSGLTKQRIIYDYPPLIKEIRAKFPIDNHYGVIFSWGDVIYNPNKVNIPQRLLNHEGVHGTQQLEFSSVEDWWRLYLHDKAFRLDQELFAHVVEYITLLQQDLNRHRRRAALSVVAKRLASPLYGNMVSVGKAKRMIIRELQEVNS